MQLHHIAAACLGMQPINVLSQESKKLALVFTLAL
jgi:hypothetical protein